MGFYEILITGELEKYREAYFEDMETEKMDDGTTRLSGFLTDSSALYGVINKMRDMGLELISLERTDFEQT